MYIQKEGGGGESKEEGREVTNQGSLQHGNCYNRSVLFSSFRYQAALCSLNKSLHLPRCELS